MVPNFVTSNAFIGRAYASIVAGVLRDLFDAHGGNHAPSNVRGNPSQPVYIVEVGAGHGRLAFLIVSALMDMRCEAWPRLQARVFCRCLLTPCYALQRHTPTA